MSGLSEAEDIEAAGETLADLYLETLFNGTNFDICEIEALRADEHFASRTEYEKYELDIRLLARYLKVYGLFEIKNNSNYKVLNESVNSDNNAWKGYNNS